MCCSCSCQRESIMVANEQNGRAQKESAEEHRRRMCNASPSRSVRSRLKSAAVCVSDAMPWFESCCVVIADKFGQHGRRSMR